MAVNRRLFSTWAQLLILCSAFDALFTIVALQLHCCEESNPVMWYCITHFGLAIFVMLKLAPTVMAAWLFERYMSGWLCKILYYVFYSMYAITYAFVLMSIGLLLQS